MIRYARNKIHLKYMPAVLKILSEMTKVLPSVTSRKLLMN